MENSDQTKQLTRLSLPAREKHIPFAQAHYPQNEPDN